MSAADTLQMHFRKVPTIRIDIRKEERKDGAILLRSAVELEPYPFRLTEKLKHWAAVAPGRVFIARKDNSASWESLTYEETLKNVTRIAFHLLQKNLSASRPVAILSENSIEHALVALAALHVGIPFSPISPAYSLRSSDFQKLKYVINLLTPGLIFVDDGIKYEAALKAVGRGVEVVTVRNSPKEMNVTMMDELLSPSGNPGEVENAYRVIQPDTVAKILFTSGSAGLPKGVINTHGNISANWQQITQTFPFMQDEGLEFVDWLPWNHTFGGNHNFGLTIYNGGSLYIDDGNPTPAGIETTVSNLRERNPTIYFNVPKGFAALIPFFKADRELRNHFFSNLKMIFYAGAGMPQHLWDAWEELALESTGEKILIGTGLGCTEACPSALFASEPGGFAGLLGVPVPGLELKLVQKAGKLEARYRGKNIFPGYWRQPELTKNAFDEEGFYCTGDALKFVNIKEPNMGMIFDGRISEDFKLNSGTWVSVGVLKAMLIAESNGLIQDAVITGHDDDFVGAIVFPDLNYCKLKFRLNKTDTICDLTKNKEILHTLRMVLQLVADKSTGNSTMIRRAIVADFNLSFDKGEITDKGSINQAIIIQNHPEAVEKIYSSPVQEDVVDINTE